MKNDPYFTTARFNSVCPETGKAIRKGDDIAYFPYNRKAYHVDSRSAEQVRGMQFSSNSGMMDADW